MFDYLDYGTHRINLIRDCIPTLIHWRGSGYYFPVKVESHFVFMPSPMAATDTLEWCFSQGEGRGEKAPVFFNINKMQYLNPERLQGHELDDRWCYFSDHWNF